MSALKTSTSEPTEIWLLGMTSRCGGRRALAVFNDEECRPPDKFVALELERVGLELPRDNRERSFGLCIFPIPPNDNRSRDIGLPRKSDLFVLELELVFITVFALVEPIFSYPDADFGAFRI